MVPSYIAAMKNKYVLLQRPGKLVYRVRIPDGTWNKYLKKRFVRESK
jgi:hypothetical protein